MNMRPMHFGTALVLLGGLCLVLGQKPAAPTARRPLQTRLQSLASLNGKLFAAAPGEIRMLDAQGKQSDFAKVPYQDMSLAPFGSKLLIGDRRGKTVFTFDTETKRSTQLLKLDEIRMEPKSVPPDSLLRLGTLNSIGSDGKTVYLGIGAGFSSAIFQVDPASKRVLNRQWAGSPDPHDIAFGDGSVFVLNPQYSEVRRFSEDLQRTSHKFDTETKGSFGMAIQGQSLLFLHPDGQTLLRQNPDPKFLLKSTLNSSLVLATNPRFINRAWINPGIINLLLPQKYAVLICGDKAEDFAGECFWNDTIWMYKQLINNGYSAHNIFVCYGDGADYHSANPFYQYSHNIVNFAGTYNAVAQLLTGLKNGDATNHIPAMRSQDSLFVWTFDHGGTWGPGQDYIYLSGIGMSVTDFAARANAIPYSTRSIFMQQCFSGGFIPVLQNATTFIGTACNATQEAYPGGGTESYGGKTYNHGGFNYYVIGAMAHAYPNGTPVNADSNHDGHRSSLELYQFAAANNTLPENPEDANLGSVGANFWFK